MTADTKLQSLYELFGGTLNLTTNIMTPEGRKIACTWIHVKKWPIGYQGDAVDHQDTTCMVTGDSLEEVIRKVAEMEADFDEVKE